jgi:hypothetical protein
VWDKPSQPQAQLGDLELRLAGVETQLNTALGILAMTRPAATVLSRSGADQAQQQEFFRLIDELTKRVDSGASVSFSEFEDRVVELVPARRGDRKFFEVLIEAVKLERPSAKPMLDYLIHVMAIFRS